ncbi:Acetyl-coenzyme A synthetase [Chryseobacterium aquaeductus]|uniref:Acetyl-coenzyme A synthetase n=1 Tax=Chryseobacterium aquaeductus TaxID=2675056 RepID=A0A9N8QTW0_9FLAO|nr:AMP-binding protein [Chryseobacterium aquaeductus]CAA7332459.1 Acetyl-coenzyme A synthetase [Chryseobacterium potabilaquae]CAD7816502.1 Acetyl-coenzyme A synthetase [Chryseobacterium aquaeductus]
MKAKDLFYRSIEDHETFWKEQAKEISWFHFPGQIISKDENDYTQWFADGKLNMCYLCIDKHIEDGFGEEIAIIYDSPVTNQKLKYTYHQAKEEISKLAGGLLSLGLKKGDTAVIYMPMIPQTLFSMLACARIGVIHNVVFGGFAPHELVVRIDDCKPKALITATAGVEIAKRIPYLPLVEKAIELAQDKVENIIVFNRKLVENQHEMFDGLIDYEELVQNSKPADCVSVESNHPLYLLYTSGTTGKPKGITRDSGGYATALKFSMKYIYGIEPGETFWAASDFGWAVGHSYTVYGPLINRNTTIIFEGKPIMTPDAGTFWRIISEYKVAAMFTAPTAIRAIKKEDPNGELVKKYDLSNFKKQFLAGERCDVSTLDWFAEHIGVPAIDHWWQTESGSPMLGLMTFDNDYKIKRASAGKPIPGYDIKIFDENGYELDEHKEGYLVIKLPLPPGAMLGIWNDYDRFEKSYLSQYKGYYFSGDGAIKDEDGYIFITGRVDDVINVAGHRLSTSEMEEVVSSHPDVAECAVVGIDDNLRGQVPFATVVLKNGSQISEIDVEKQIVSSIREKIGAVAVLKSVMVVKRLPKTRSGKILRKLIRTIIDGRDFQIPSTIDDEKIIDELKEKIEQYKTN